MPPPPASRAAAASAPSAKPAPTWLRPAAPALAALALFSMFSAAVGDPGTWCHLRTGANIVQHHKLPVPDPFSWTTYMGQPAYPGEEATRLLNLKREWLAQVLLYLMYTAGGFPGMVLFRAACLTRFCAIVGWVAWRRTGRFYLSLAATMAAGMIRRSAAAYRPFLITYLLARGPGDLYARLGRLDSAARWLEFYLSRKTEPDPDAERLYRQILNGSFHAPSPR